MQSFFPCIFPRSQLMPGLFASANVRRAKAIVSRIKNTLPVTCAFREKLFDSSLELAHNCWVLPQIQAKEPSHMMQVNETQRA